MNKVVLLGRLTNDPEVRYTQSGKAVAGFTLAVNRFSGQGQKEADFIPCVAWEKLAEIIGNNVSKGQRLLVTGRLQIRSYEATDGTKKRVAEIIVNEMEFIEKRAAEHDSGNDDPNPFCGQVMPEEEIPF